MVEEGMTTISSPSSLSDEQLIAEVKARAASERQATAQLIAALAELDARRLYLGEGCASLFAYCTRVLHLSEHAAYGRIEAARAARRFPALLEGLAEGELTLTAVCVLAPYLTLANVASVLRDARHKSKREIELLVVALSPRPTVPSVVRKLPERTAPDVLLDRALTLLVADLEKKKIAATAHPRARRDGATRSRHVPAAVKREVWKRDGGQCAFEGTNGRCAERGFLEFHHVVPYAMGGETATTNLQLRCRAHNAYEAEQDFGPWLIREAADPWLSAVCQLGPDRAIENDPVWSATRAQSRSILRDPDVRRRRRS